MATFKTTTKCFLTVLFFALNVALTICQSTCGKPAVQASTTNFRRNVRAAQGTTPRPHKTSIMGGNEAVPHSWPWQVYYEGCHTGANCRFCGGSLISHDQVLTAAHCVAGDVKMVPSDIMVRLGTHNINSDVGTDLGGNQYSVKSITVHSQWDYSTFRNDIAILTLNTSVPYSTNVSPVCLAPTKPVAGTQCYATGWGYTENGWKNTLRQIRIAVSTDDACQKEVNGPMDGKMCMDVASGRDTCSGDSGGPIVCQENGDAWNVIGITSYGNTACATNGHPGIYTDVAQYHSWIMSMYDGGNDNTGQGGNHHRHHHHHWGNWGNGGGRSGAKSKSSSENDNRGRRQGH